MPVESPDAVNRNIIIEKAPPFVEAAARGCARILRIKRQQDDLITTGSAQLLHSFAGKGMPVAHGDKATRVHAAVRELQLQAAGLLLGETADG